MESHTSTDTNDFLLGIEDPDITRSHLAAGDRLGSRAHKPFAFRDGAGIGATPVAQAVPAAPCDNLAEGETVVRAIPAAEFESFDEASQKARLAHLSDVQKQLGGIDAKALSPGQQVNYTIYKAQIDNAVGDRLPCATSVPAMINVGMTGMGIPSWLAKILAVMTSRRKSSGTAAPNPDSYTVSM